MALAMLAIINERPPLEEIVTWIEYNTLALLFGMMYDQLLTLQSSC
jgi:hypothetical protein